MYRHDLTGRVIESPQGGGGAGNDSMRQAAGSGLRVSRSHRRAVTGFWSGGMGNKHRDQGTYLKSQARTMSGQYNFCVSSKETLRFVWRE